MLDAQPTLVQGLIRQLLFQGELLAAGFLGGHEDFDLGQRERQEAQILQQSAPRREGIRRHLGNRLLMDAAAGGVTEQEDEEQGIDSQDMLDRVVPFLATLTVRLFSRVLGADDAPFRPVMGTRGDAGAAPAAATRGAGSSSERGRSWGTRM
jgi:hypothetical protein